MTVLDQTRRRLRERQLSGDARAGTWARADARRRRWALVRHLWQFIATTLLAIAVLSAVAVWLIPDTFVRGLVVGALTAGSISALFALIVQLTGTANTTMGATAEQWTSAELRPLRRAGWKVVNHFSLRRSDIDHVVIGPAGVFAVETKWCSRGWAVERPDRYLLDALEQVRVNANDLRRWHDFKSNGVQSVQPVLCLWGTGGGTVATPKAPILIDGVVIVYGRTAAKAWRERVATGTACAGQARLDAREIEALWNVLDQSAARRDDYDAEREVQLPSIPRMCWVGLGSFAAGSVALLLSLKTGTWVNSWWLWGAITSLYAGGAAVAGRRIRWVRAYATGWVIGLLASVVLLIVRLATLL